MRGKISAILLVVLAFASLGYAVDEGKGQMLPDRTDSSLTINSQSIKPVLEKESDIIEKVSANRTQYQQNLTQLKLYYQQTGNDMKLQWAEKELKTLNRAPQYNYIIEANVAGPDLKASASIAEADLTYIKACQNEKIAKRFILLKDNNRLRMALEQYNEIIRKHPTSDKIDEAAYRAAEIFEYFNDYSIALLYYQRTYQWDSNTPYPARFKAACILDNQMHRRAEALQLYEETLKLDKLNETRRKFVQTRIEELTKSHETLKDDK